MIDGKSNVRSVGLVMLGPLVAIMFVCFLVWGIQLLNPEIRQQIDDRAVGMVIGWLGGAVVIACLMVSWNHGKRLYARFKR